MQIAMNKLDNYIRATMGMDMPKHINVENYTSL